MSSHKCQLKDTSDVYFFKLPYISNFSHHIKSKLSKLCKEFCKENFNIKLLFNSFKTKNHFSYKDQIPDVSKTLLVYKYTCTRCSSRYIGKTCRHFKTRTDEYIKKNSKFHMSKHLHFTTACFNYFYFKIIDKVKSKFDLKTEEVLHISWRKPNLNTQQNYLALTHFHYSLRNPFVPFCLCFCGFSLSYFIFIICGTSYWHLLLLITLRCYFISLQHTVYYNFPFHLLF